jgi:hypothetical protein
MVPDRMDLGCVCPFKDGPSFAGEKDAHSTVNPEIFLDALADSRQ